uniref:Multiple epidermal growth factor-like domains protein 10 isoform X3 n=1 Tax=Crassostrea virginica TaxID=6565 RepID=A0A8B8C907_CRAVI|nr:multiple epidermal growth factor-like domains protein 10 isoform X3 [Crassostrea virginica]
MDCYIVLVYLSIVLLSRAYDDISYQHYAVQYPLFGGHAEFYKATNALDRNISTCTRNEGIGLNSQHKSVMWRVDFGRMYNIYSVNILFKHYEGYEMRQRGRFAGFSIYISNSGDIDTSALCYHDETGVPPLNFTTICLSFGRYVIFYNERLNGVSYPEKYEVSNVFTELCEVIVYGCKTAGTYGNNCDSQCPRHCRYNTCHIQSGTCFECEPGWIGSYCRQECAEGWYGQNCTLKCSGHCRDNASCDHVTGQCLDGCDAEWKGSRCDVEQIDLSYQKAATQLPLYSGLHELFKANNAVDRNITTCTRTDIIGPNSPDKRAWWKVDLGGMYHVNSIRIAFKKYDDFEMRQRGRLAGFSLFVSTDGSIENSSLCYKDGPKLPPLDFITHCVKYGRYVIFYNERLDAVSYPASYEHSSYTELCELTVYGCNKSGLYGNKCDFVCPVRCKDKICDIKNGTCLSCEPGFFGNYCTIDTFTCGENSA